MALTIQQINIVLLFYVDLLLTSVTSDRNRCYKLTGMGVTS